MQKPTFEDIASKGLLIYECLTGPKVYGTDGDSDNETRLGVYVAPDEYDLRTYEIDSPNGRVRWVEIGKFMRGCLEGDRTFLEALFCPEKFITVEHPVFRKIRERRMELLSKETVESFKKDTGEDLFRPDNVLKLTDEDKKLKLPADYCTILTKNGEESLTGWLESNGLKEYCCGLKEAGDMENHYLLYYDFRKHILFEKTDLYSEVTLDTPFFRFLKGHFKECVFTYNGDDILGTFLECEEIRRVLKDYGTDGCDGIRPGNGGCNPSDGTGPIGQVFFNREAYDTHCRKYDEWMRYSLDTVTGRPGPDNMQWYDGRVMQDRFRRLAMCIEMAQGFGIIPDRKGVDSEFLGHVKSGVYTYMNLVDMLDEMHSDLEHEMGNTRLKDKTDPSLAGEMVCKLMEDFRNHKTDTGNVAEVVEPAEPSAGACVLDTGRPVTEEGKLFSVLDEFTYRLGISRDDVMVTGSMALKMNGMLPGDRRIHDLDIVVRCNKETERDIQTMTRIGGGNTFWTKGEYNIDGVAHKPYIFRYLDTEFNVWILKDGEKFDTEIMTEHGYRLATVKHVLDAKKTYGRKKDIDDINRIANAILDTKRKP